MDEKGPIPTEPSRQAGKEPETPTASSGRSPGGATRPKGGAKPAQSRPAKAEPPRVEIVLRVAPAEPQQPTPISVAKVAAEPTSVPTTATEPAANGPALEVKMDRRPGEPRQIPARMLNEFVYCRRLFYYEFVEGVFVESADTLRGDAIHQRVDTGTGALPKAGAKPETRNPKSEEGNAVMPPGNEAGASPQPQGKEAQSQIQNPKSKIENEVIHSRSVQMGSERLGVVAKMDLVEARATGAARADDAEKEDLFTALEVCPVDYKAGAPKEGAEGAGRAGQNELWDTDKMQLGLQALILRDNGYTCQRRGHLLSRHETTRSIAHHSGIGELDSRKHRPRRGASLSGPIPAPLVHSPKCVRCSLAPVCLPDETRMLAETESPR